MKYTELQTTINNLKIKSKKKLVEALNELLKGEGFKAVEHWNKSNSALVEYKGQTAFYVDGEKWDAIEVHIESANTDKKKVFYGDKSWQYNYSPVVNDTDQDKKRIERYLARVDYFHSNPFEYSYFSWEDAYTTAKPQGTKNFLRMRELLQDRKHRKQDLEKANIPFNVYWYLKSLAEMSDKEDKKTEFLEEMPKAYTKVLELIAEDNKDRAKYLESAKARVTDFIAERKTYKAF